MKYPKLIIIGVTAIGIVIVLIIIEILMENKKNVQFSSMQRFIRLREQRLNYKGEIIPSNETWAFVDGLVNRGYLFETDGNGFIAPSRLYESPDIQIAFLGGSTTECKFVAPEKRFPARVGNLLSQDLRLQVNSYNSGVGGNDTSHCLNILFNKILPLKPDYVFLMENINDLIILMIYGTYWHDNPYRGLLISAKKDRLAYLKDGLAYGLFPGIYSTIVDPLMKKYGDEFKLERGKPRKNLDKKQMLQLYQSNITLFVDMCRAYNIKPVLMTQFNRFIDHPDPVIVKSSERFEKDWGVGYGDLLSIYREFNNTMIAVAEEKKVKLIDLDKMVPKTKEYMYDIVHLNENGSIFVSDIIYKEMSKEIDVKK